MIATYINCLAVIVGSLIGLFLKKHIKEEFKNVIITCGGLVTIVLGVKMSLESTNILVLILALIAGGLIGSLLNIDSGIYNLGLFLEKKTSKNSKQNDKENSEFAKGFITASLLFCSGAMTIIGSIQAGTTGNYQTLLIKSVMDGCMAIVFSSTYGAGVIFSAFFVFLYQGFFTLAGGWIEAVIKTEGITEMSAIGGVLLLMIALDMLDIKKIKTANYLPALIFSPIFLKLFLLFT